MASKDTQDAASYRVVTNLSGTVKNNFTVLYKRTERTD